MQSNEDNEQKLDILAFGAHPDDVEVGCGGLLLKVAKMGYKTGIVDLSLAELSTNGDTPSRLREADQSRKILNVKVRENLGIPNNFFFNSKEVQDKIIRVIRKYQPEMILMPYFSDRHPDHEEAPKLIKQAIFTSGLIKYETEQKNWRPKYVFYYMLWYEFEPSFIVDISDEFEIKLKAYLAYGSQFKLDKNRLKTIDNDAKTLKFFEARNRHYGFNISRTYGEPYLSTFPLGINNPFDYLPNLF